MLTRGEFSEQRGYFTFAKNTSKCDYLRLAYLEAVSIKKTQKINSYAVAVDAETMKDITDVHRKVFDYVIEIPDTNELEDATWKLGDEWKAFWLTPFKETVKLDCDMTFNRNIDHWWNVYQLKDVLFTSQVVDYLGKVSSCRTYRKLFDDNTLPNIYSAFFYFRYSLQSAEFFDLSRKIYQNWFYFRDELLINCRDEYPTTDVVFSIAAKILGEEQFYIPDLSIPKIVHMKGAIQGWGVDDDWTTRLYSQIDDNYTHTVGFTRQDYPFHYYQKDYATDEVIKKYVK
jgi:hypothetical protein